MRYRKLGTTDLDVSVICLGTMTWGEQNSKQDAFQHMDYSLDRGVNFFDTAEIYPVMPRQETYGRTEEIIGDWFQKKRTRDKVILASKIASKSTAFEWIRGCSKTLRFDKKNMNLAIEESLRRLKTDYIDLYQLHWPQRNVPSFGNLDFECKDGLESGLGLSWARFWCYLGPLGGSFGDLGAARWHPGFPKLFISAPLSPHLGPRGALNSPKQLPRRPHGEADGPTKPPRPIWRRIWSCFPCGVGGELKQMKQETSFKPFEPILGSRFIYS